MEQLLTTKLHIPPTRPGFVARTNLIERLNAQRHRKLTLVSAPAGFGKTTLVSAWIASCDPLAAWVSLDERDNDPHRFLTYLCAALQSIMPGVQGVLSALQSSQPPPIESILITILNEITTGQKNVVLVLDDYHIIDSKPVDSALAFLIEHLPPQMHLVMTTREDPQLPLARLRARNQLTELRVADLRFTQSEAAEFLNKTMHLDLSDHDIAALETRTEGWITGLQLAAISMQGHQDTSSFVRSFTGSHRFVLDYLIEEVLHQQSESIQTFLLCTSILDRLFAPLCDAVVKDIVTPGQEILAFIERANLLVIPLDDNSQWYRYHHLFADVLRARLVKERPDQVSALHRRASEWYQQHAMWPDAIHHALVAEDFARAADLAEIAWPSMTGSYQSIAWLGWLKALPDELVRDRPVLCAAYAWANLNSGNLEAAEARLQDAERWLEPASSASHPSTPMIVIDEALFQALPVSIATARAYHAQATGNVQNTMKYAQRALDLISDETPSWRVDITALLGLAYWATGDLEAAHQTFFDGLSGMTPLDIIVGTFVLADLKTTLGHLHEAVNRYHQSLQLAAEVGVPLPIGTEDLYTGISKLHREQGDLEAAKQALMTARQLGDQVELPDWQYRWCIAMAQLKKSQGEPDIALDMLDEAARLYVRTPLPDVHPIAAQKARIWAAQGRLDEALTWVHHRDFSANDTLSYLSEYEHITLARVLIALHKADRSDNVIHDALDLLDRLLQAAKEGKRKGSVIEIHILQALALGMQGDSTAALDPLQQALTLAEPEGYIRVFVDEGDPMAKLLNEMAARGVLPDYVNRLLAELAHEHQNHNDTARRQHQPLVDPLSPRELEVLQLIAEGLSNREISERLFLALSTVKGHNRLIYDKLAVQRRTEAVARARELGLL